MRFILLLLMPVLLFGCGEGQAWLAAKNLSGAVLIINVPKDTKPSKDDLQDHKGGGLGTGFVIGENLIVTNNHVIEGGGNLRVIGYRDNKPYVARVIAADKEADLAVVRLEEWDDFEEHVNPAILPWGDSRNLKVGETVWSMGNPYGLTWTVAQGIISHKLRQTKEGGSYYIQTTTQIYPGNSGGPLLDERGYVVAVNSAIVGKEGYFGMAIPASYARKVVEDLINHGTVQRARMGINVGTSDDHHGIKVLSISQSSTAIKAGLLPNDVILGIATEDTGWRFVETRDADELISEVILLEPGKFVNLTIARDGTKRTVSFQVVPAG